jgi:hypothetical protein
MNKLTFSYFCGDDIGGAACVSYFGTAVFTQIFTDIYEHMATPEGLGKILVLK